MIQIEAGHQNDSTICGAVVEITADTESQQLF